MAKRFRLAIVVLCSCFAVASWADVPGTTAIVTPPQPQWSELTVEQKVILAPLSDDWDAMEYHRQKKWLGITRRFQGMTPAEQRRIQEQMQAWGKLTPEQRNLARENFKTASKLPLGKKAELRQKWEEYSSLPEEEKERLKQQATGKAGSRPVGMAGAITAPPLASSIANPPSGIATPPSGMGSMSAPAAPAPTSETSVTRAQPPPNVTPPTAEAETNR